MMNQAVRREHQRRLELWAALQTDFGAKDIPAAMLRQLSVYGGFQGIWVDTARTSDLTSDGKGITMAVLNSGRHYPDDLSEDGIIYHYPATRRGATRDTGEIVATKHAAELGLPLFVIIGRTHTTRDVRLGWVTDWDDESKQFLIVYSESRALRQESLLDQSEAVQPLELRSDTVHFDDHNEDHDDNLPFALHSTQAGKRHLAKSRMGQQQFKFHVFKRYGPKCAVCSMRIPEVLQAAHIVPVEEDGANDARNGLVLCANHHLALDAGLFAIDPISLAVLVTESDPGREALGISETHLSPLRHQPHGEALTWRFEQWATQRG
jgi:hypothetical protein